MTVTATEFKVNLGKYLLLAKTQDIYISKNGKKIAKLTTPDYDKLNVLDSLVGIIPKDEDIDEDKARSERLNRQ